MNLKLILAFLFFSSSSILFGSCKQVEDVRITCSELKSVTVEFLGDFKACYNAFDSLTITNPDSKVSSIVYSDGSDVANLSEIDALQIYNSVIISIPDGIADKLQKLRALVINWSCLETLNQENMQQFGASLEHAEFIGNRLTTLDTDLFKHNRNLKMINFSSNPFNYIDPIFFENLKNLINPLFINFHFTNCINQNFFFHSDVSLVNFEWKLERCTSQKTKFEQAVNNGEKDCCVQQYRKRK